MIELDLETFLPKEKKSIVKITNLIYGATGSGIQGLIHALRRTQIRESMASSIYQQTPARGVEGFELSLWTMLPSKCSSHLPFLLWEAMPQYSFPKAEFSSHRVSGSKLQTGRAGQAIWCLNHYLHCTLQPRASPWSDSERLPRSISARLVLWCKIIFVPSLAFWPKKWKRRRGRDSSVLRALEPGIWPTSGAERCSAWAVNPVQGPSSKVRLITSSISDIGELRQYLYPEWCAGPSPSLSHQGQGHPP